MAAQVFYSTIVQFPNRNIPYVLVSEWPVKL